MIHSSPRNAPAPSVIETIEQEDMGSRTRLERQPHLVPLGDLVPNTEQLRTDGINQAHVQTLAELDNLPPILVRVSSIQIIDGMHRLHAATLRGGDTIPVEFSECDDSEVLVTAVKANNQHGLPLSLEDRKRAAARIIQQNPHWSNRAIAKVSGISDKTAAVVRDRSTAENPKLNAHTGQDDRSRPHSTSDARRRAGEMIANDSRTSVRSVARAVGLEPATGRDVRERIRRGEDPVPPQQHRRKIVRGAMTYTIGVPADGWNPQSAIDNLNRDPSLKQTDAGKQIPRASRVRA